MMTHGSIELQQTINLLTKDEALAILAYTCEDPYPVYKWLNAWLVQNRRDDDDVKSSVGPFFQLVYRGLEKLPRRTIQAGRGVKVGDIPVLRSCFDSPPLPGETLSFWGVSSFSKEDSVMVTFAEGAGDGILFKCGRLECVELGEFSLKPNEAEVVPLPPAVFQVFFCFIYCFCFCFILFYFVLFYHFVLFCFVLFCKCL